MALAHALRFNLDHPIGADHYDRFLRIAEEAKADPKAVAAWERAGACHFQEEDDMRVIAIARFPGKIKEERG